MTTVAAELGTLTPRQREVAEAFLALEGETGSPPTYRDLCVRLGVAGLNTVTGHLKALARKGWASPPAGVGRHAWKLTPAARAALGAGPADRIEPGHLPAAFGPFSVRRDGAGVRVTVRRSLTRDEALELAKTVRSAALAPGCRGR